MPRLRNLNSIPGAGWQLDTAEIEETLSIYRPEHRYIQSAWLSADHHLLCDIRLAPYPFVLVGHIEYVTAAMAVLYVAQAGYVYTRCVVEGRIANQSPPLSIEQFFAARDAGRIVFHAFDGLRFHRKIQVSDGAMTLRLRLRRLLSTKRVCVASFEYSGADGAFAGVVRGAIGLE